MQNVGLFMLFFSPASLDDLSRAFLIVELPSEPPLNTNAVRKAEEAALEYAKTHPDWHFQRVLTKRCSDPLQDLFMDKFLSGEMERKIADPRTTASERRWVMLHLRALEGEHARCDYAHPENDGCMECAAKIRVYRHFHPLKELGPASNARNARLNPAVLARRPSTPSR